MKRNCKRSLTSCRVIKIAFNARVSFQGTRTNYLNYVNLRQSLQGIPLLVGIAVFLALLELELLAAGIESVEKVRLLNSPIT